MKVRDIMTADEVKVCSMETKLDNAARIMRENNNGSLPVIDKNQKVIGIITDRDICLSLATTDKKPSSISVHEILPKGKIRTVRPNDEIDQVLAEMRKNRVSRLPVTDKEGRLCGIVSVNSLLSRAITKNETMGQLKSKNENLAKTLKALVDRNSLKSRAKKTTV